MRIGIVAGLLAFAGASAASAQSEKAAIVGVVNKLFDGMRTRDTALMRAQLAPHARLIGIDAKSGQPTVQVIDPSLWIGGVGKSSGPAWDEKLFDPVVEVDGSIAHVWTYYEFWLGDKLSHCGYDSLFLVKLGDGWKINQVADTRKTDCVPRR